MSVFWAACGFVAFATYLVRRRHRDCDWPELLFQLFGAILLGAVALAGVLTNEDRRA